jgi:hypothetical protein
MLLTKPLQDMLAAGLSPDAYTYATMLDLVSRYSGYSLFWYKSTNTDAKVLCRRGAEKEDVERVVALMSGSLKLLVYEALSCNKLLVDAALSYYCMKP